MKDKDGNDVSQPIGQFCERCWVVGSEILLYGNMDEFIEDAKQEVMKKRIDEIVRNMELPEDQRKQVQDAKTVQRGSSLKANISKHCVGVPGDLVKVMVATQRLAKEATRNIPVVHRTGNAALTDETPESNKLYLFADSDKPYYSVTLERSVELSCRAVEIAQADNMYEGHGVAVMQHFESKTLDTGFKDMLAGSGKELKELSTFLDDYKEWHQNQADKRKLRGNSGGPTQAADTSPGKIQGRAASFVMMEGDEEQ